MFKVSGTATGEPRREERQLARFVNKPNNSQQPGRHQ